MNKIRRIKTTGLLFLAISLWILSACTPRLDQYAGSYVKSGGFSSWIMYDSIEFSHRTLGDIEIPRDRRVLKKAASKAGLRNLLEYGKTVLPPFYEYYILRNAKTKANWTRKFQLMRDTAIDNYTLHFLGRGVNDRLPDQDFNLISGNILHGSDFRKPVIDNYKGLRDEESYLQIPDGKIWYKIIGSGKEIPLLTLHGGPGSRSRYFYQLSPLADERPIILFDQLGSGRSDHHRDTSILNVSHFIEQVLMVRDSLGLKDFYLLGQSWGSALALEFYQKYPEGIKGLIFSGPFFSTELWERDADIHIASLDESIQDIIAKAEEDSAFDTKEYQYADSVYWATFGRRKPWPEHPMDTADSPFSSFVYNYMWGPSEFTALGTLKNYDNSEALKSIEIPVLFIAGEFDESRKETVEYFNSMVDKSEMIIIPDAGHSSMTDNPEAYRKAVKDFLQTLEKKVKD